VEPGTFGRQIGAVPRSGVRVNIAQQTETPVTERTRRVMLKQVSLMAMLLGMGWVVPAAADGTGSTSGPILWRPHPFKERQCVADCRQDELTCLKDARDAAAPCFQGCQALVDAAHTACDAAPQSDACKTAAQAARTCLDPCYTELRPVANGCREEGRVCVRACPFVGEPPCLAACRADYVHCLADTRDALMTCRQGCDDEYKAARAACASDPQSDACSAARAALNTCLAPCRASLKQDLEQCGTALGQCAAKCDDGGQPTN